MHVIDNYPVKLKSQTQSVYALAQFSIYRLSVQKWPVFVPTVLLCCFIAAFRRKVAVKTAIWKTHNRRQILKDSKTTRQSQLCYQCRSWFCIRSIS